MPSAPPHSPAATAAAVLRARADALDTAIDAAVPAGPVRDLAARTTAAARRVAHFTPTVGPADETCEALVVVAQLVAQYQRFADDPVADRPVGDDGRTIRGHVIDALTAVTARVEMIADVLALTQARAAAAIASATEARHDPRQGWGWEPSQEETTPPLPATASGDGTGMGPVALVIVGALTVGALLAGAHACTTATDPAPHGPSYTTGALR